METLRQLTPVQRAEVRDLLDAARRIDGYEPLAEHKAIRLGRDGPGGGFVALLARAPDGRLRGYAQLAAAHASTGLEVVVHPDGRADETMAGALVQAAMDVVALEGGGTVRWSMAAPPPSRLALAEQLGFSPERRLVQMVAPLPLEAALVGAAWRTLEPFVVRPFEPGADEAQWLEVNALAFADHPEQGAWTAADLVDREQAPWFDPAGFLVAIDDGRLVASCLTKLHPASEPTTGEIYVISVDPAWHGRGLGKAMTVAGLEHLAGRGAQRGMLYVDEDNAAAMALYRGLGFSVDHVDRSYVRHVAGRP